MFSLGCLPRWISTSHRSNSVIAQLRDLEHPYNLISFLNIHQQHFGAQHHPLFLFYHSVEMDRKEWYRKAIYITESIKKDFIPVTTGSIETMGELVEEVFFCSFCMVGLLGKWNFNRPLCSSSLRTATCAAISRCLWNINIHFLQAQSLHGQNFLCPFSKAMMPWFRHLAQRGDLVSTFISSNLLSKTFVNWLLHYWIGSILKKWYYIFRSTSQFYHFSWSSIIEEMILQKAPPIKIDTIANQFEGINSIVYCIWRALYKNI